MADERVLCIPAGRLRELGHFEGFRPAGDAFRDAILDPAGFSFRPRSEVETDPSYKQLIPYVVLKCGDAVFCYRRGAKGGEGRLHAKWSVGIGGHINEEDAAGEGNAYLNGLAREVEEEVRFSGGEGRLIGFVNDESDAVGSVHLGVVELFELERPEVTAVDEALGDGRFLPLDEAAARAETFETWSRFVLTHLLKVRRAAATPHHMAYGQEYTE